MHFCRSSSNVPRLPSFLEMLQNPHVLLTCEKVHNPSRLPRETTTQRPKVVRTPSVFNILTSKCASRHNGVHFFDISTSKSGPLVCFVHFDFEMCFAPQRRALFRHLNFQKWSGPGVFRTFWLWNVLRATTACTFSTSQLPNVVRSWCALYTLTSKCALRHNGVRFFDISTSKSGPGMVCFVYFDFDMLLRATTACNFSSLIWPDGSAPVALANLLFDPPGPQIIRKTKWLATFLLFRASASSFFWLFLFSDLLSSTLLFSDSSHLWFSSVHIVGSLTSKLPSAKLHYTILQLQQHYLTLHYTRLNYTIPHYSTQHYSTQTTKHYTNYTSPQLQLKLPLQLHYAYYTLQVQLHYTTLQLQLQLHYTTLHPAVVGEVTAATTATTPTNTPSATFGSISGFALPSMHHNNSPLL